MERLTTTDLEKIRATALALRRGFGITRIDRVVYLVDRDGAMRLLCTVDHSKHAWQRACDVLEAAST